MPEDPSSVLITVATGTGIAPFRAFWRRLFYEKIPGEEFKGLLWVFMGVANSDAKLYDEEMQVGSLTRADFRRALGAVYSSFLFVMFNLARLLRAHLGCMVLTMWIPVTRSLNVSLHLNLGVLLWDTHKGT